MSPSHRHLYEKHSLSISKQTYLNRECNRLGMSTLQGTFSLMRISDQDSLKLSSFSVPSVISIHFPVFPWVYSKGDSPMAHHGITNFEAISDMEPRHGLSPGQSWQKSSSLSLYFKIILHPVSVFLRNYFFFTNGLRPKVIS